MRVFQNRNLICIMSFAVFYLLAIISLLKGHPWSPIDFASGNIALAMAFKLRNKK